MVRRLLTLGLMLIAIAVTLPQAKASDQTRKPSVDLSRADVWNRFADALVALHRHIVATRNVRVTDKIDGFARYPNFYHEERVHDAATGRLLSVVQWLTSDPGKAYAAEVYLYDAGGRLLCDYRATYLPEHRNAPIQTLINLHGGMKGLTAFRQFDASGDLIYQACRGEWLGKAVDISIDEPTAGVPREISASEAYGACFDSIPLSAAPYLDPRTMIDQRSNERSVERPAATKPRQR